MVLTIDDFLEHDEGSGDGIRQASSVQETGFSSTNATKGIIKMLLTLHLGHPPAQWQEYPAESLVHYANLVADLRYH